MTVSREDARRCSLLALVAALAALGLLGPAGAAAATRVGNTCEANAAASTPTFIQLSRAEPGPDLSVPSAGVLSSWSVSVVPIVGSRPQVLKILRPTGVSNRFQVVAESAAGSVISGANSFDARISVEAGDRLGLVAAPPSEATLYCAPTEPSDAIGIFTGDAAVGGSFDFEEASGLQVPVSALVEPDADGDGYGDETQDNCPQSSLFSGECPPPVTLIVKPKVRKRSILLGVTPSGAASVDVYGQVGWNFQSKRGKQRGHRRHRGAHASKRKKNIKRLIVGLNGGIKQVTPGVLTRFTIRLPGPVKLRLSRLTRRESIRAKLTLRATNPAGIAKNTRLRVKLRGWRKSTPTRRGAHR